MNKFFSVAAVGLILAASAHALQPTTATKANTANSANAANMEAGKQAEALAAGIAEARDNRAQPAKGTKIKTEDGDVITSGSPSGTKETFVKPKTAN